MLSDLNASYIAILKYPDGIDRENEKMILESGFRYTAELIKDKISGYKYLTEERRKLYLGTLSAKNLMSSDFCNDYLLDCVVPATLHNSNLIATIGNYELFYAKCTGALYYFRYIIDTYLSSRKLDYCLGVIDDTKFSPSYGLFKSTKDEKEDFFDLDSRIDFLNIALDRFEDVELCSYCKEIHDMIEI